MELVNRCQLCDSENIALLKEYTFRYPGAAIQEHLLDIKFERLWILFERILKSRGESKFGAYLCRNCGFIFLNPRFSEEDFAVKYNTIVELNSVKYREQKSPPPSNLIDMRVDRIHRLVRPLLNNGSSRPRILDFGGQSGFILKPFIGECECGVIDYERWELPEGVAYLGRDFSDLGSNDKFDAVLFLHTLEHVLKPMDMVRSIGSFLTEGGILYIEVPLGCFREWMRLRDPLTHINFFSEESLFNCFTAAGLNVVSLETDFQWVKHGRELCLNIVGRKESPGNNHTVVPLTTRRQMNRVRYFLNYRNMKRLAVDVVLARHRGVRSVKE